MSAPRIFCIPATRAPVAAVLARGPSDWVRLGRWHLERDEYEHGAWLAGPRVTLQKRRPGGRRRRTHRRWSIRRVPRQPQTTTPKFGTRSNARARSRRSRTCTGRTGMRPTGCSWRRPMDACRSEGQRIPSLRPRYGKSICRRTSPTRNHLPTKRGVGEKSRDLDYASRSYRQSLQRMMLPFGYSNS